MRRVSSTVFSMMVLLSSCSYFKKENVRYHRYQIARADLVEYVEADGSLEMERSIDVLPPVDGRIDKLYVKEGDRVRRGQLLGLMSSNTRATILDMAAGKGSEEKKYWEQQILPTRIFAPVSGKIVDIRSLEGENARGSLMNISTGLVVRSNIDESDLPSIKVGQSVRIEFDVFNGHEALGTITDIKERSRVINNVNVYPIEVKIPEETLDRLPFETKIGMSVTLLITVQEKKDALSLPVKAFEGRFETEVEAELRNHQPIQISLGKIYGENVEVLSKIAEGTTILVPSIRQESSAPEAVPFFLKSQK